MPSSILITAAGMPDFEITGCEWLHAIVDADGDAAMTYAVAAGTMPQPGASGQPGGPTQPADGLAASPLVLVAISAAAVAVIVVVLLVVARRRTGAKPTA